MKRDSLGRSSEVRVGLHAVLADVETFDLFLLCDTNTAEDGADDLPDDQRSHDGGYGIREGTHELDTQLGKAMAG